MAAEQDYALANRPINVAVGDFNGDGRMDIAVAVAPLNGETGASGVYVLFGQTNGTYAAPVQVDASVNPASLAVGDLNGDGRADLVVGDQGIGAQGQRTAGLLHIYLGNANGTFTPTTAPTSTATFYTDVALGDLNKDGKLDLVVAGTVGTTIGALTNNLYVLHGNGDGTFQGATTEPLAGTDGIGATSLVLADFNGDGTLDIAIGNPNDFTEIMLSSGNGTFAHTLMALAQQPQSLAAAALPGHQFADLVVGSTGVGTAVYLNPGNAAAWTAPTTPPPTVSLSLILGVVPTHLLLSLFWRGRRMPPGSRCNQPQTLAHRRSGLPILPPRLLSTGRTR